MIHVNFRCLSFSVIMKVFAIFWVVNLRRLATLNWCWWLEHMFHIFKCRWQHIVTKGRFWELCVVRKWAISKSCTNGLDYFFCHIRLPQNVEYLTCIRFDPAYFTHVLPNDVLPYPGNLFISITDQINLPLWGKFEIYRIYSLPGGECPDRLSGIVQTFLSHIAEQ